MTRMASWSKRDDRARAVAEVEAHGDVDHDADDGEEQRLDAVVAQLGAGLGADRLHRRDVLDAAGAEPRLERVPHLDVEADEDDLVGVVLGAAVALHGVVLRRRAP